MLRKLSHFQTLNNFRAIINVYVILATFITCSKSNDINVTKHTSGKFSLKFIPTKHLHSIWLTNLT